MKEKIIRSGVTKLVIKISRYPSVMFTSTLAKFHKNLSGYVTLHYQHQYYVCAFRKPTPRVRGS
jgi:hypothetical protein